MDETRDKVATTTAETSSHWGLHRLEGMTAMVSATSSIFGSFGLAANSQDVDIILHVTIVS
jgi:hypothetical protein